MSARLNLTAYEQSVLRSLKRNKKYKDLVISPSYLRVETPIVNGKNSFQFPVLSVGGESLTEKKLDKNDSFVATKIGVLLMRRDTVLKDEAIQPLQTYPNETYFPAVAGPPAFTPGHLEAIYNGSLSLKKGTRVIIEQMSMLQFRDASLTQQSSASNKSDRSADTGLVALNPAFNVPGRDQVSITMDIPAFSSIAWQDQTANKEIRIVLFLQGFLVKGAYVN